MQPASWATMTETALKPGSAGLSCRHSHTARFSLVGLSRPSMSLRQRWSSAAWMGRQAASMSAKSSTQPSTGSMSPLTVSSTLNEWPCRREQGWDSGKAGRRRAHCRWKMRKMSMWHFRACRPRWLCGGYRTPVAPATLCAVLSCCGAIMSVSRLSVAALAAFALLSLGACSRDNGLTLSAPDAYAQVQAGTLTLIDVRTSDEWRQTGGAQGALRGGGAGARGGAGGGRRGGAARGGGGGAAGGRGGRAGGRAARA